MMELVVSEIRDSDNFKLLIRGVDVRHNCDQGDGMESYGYIEHDGRTAATQAIKDTLNNVQITTEFLKIPGGDAGNASEWSLN